MPLAPHAVTASSIGEARAAAGLPLRHTLRLRLHTLLVACAQEVLLAPHAVTACAIREPRAAAGLPLRHTLLRLLRAPPVQQAVVGLAARTAATAVPPAA